MSDLIGTADVKTSLEITTATYDPLISVLVSAASEAIQQRCQREFIGTVATRTFPIRRRLIDLAPYDVRASTTPTVVLSPEEGATTLTVNVEYLLKPQGGAKLGQSYQQILLSPRVNLTSTLMREFGEARVSVAGTWGVWGGTATVDPAVKRAAALTCSAWMDRAVAEYAVDDGREIRPDRFSTWAIPMAAITLLNPWMRIGT